MENLRKILILLVLGLQLACLSHADVGEKANFSSLSGTAFYQQPVSPADLRGKVVFIEYWGLQCPPCRAAMPKLQALYDKYKNQGFVLIASHWQMPNAAAINDYFSQNKLTFPSCEHFQLPQAPLQGGLPLSVLVGADGKVVAIGMPAEVEAKVEEEIKKVAGGVPILSDLTLDKYRKMQTTILEGAPNIEAKIAPLRQKKDDEEAQQICEAYDAWLEQRKTAIAGCREQDACRFVAQANTLKKSVPSVSEFDADLAKLTANPDYIKLSDMRKKEKAARKKCEGGKKVSPKAIEAMAAALADFSSDDAGISGSAEELRSSLETLAEQVKDSGAKKTKDSDKADRKKRGSL